MTRLRLATVEQCSWVAGGYSSPQIRHWPPGETREVDADTASYLLRSFPDAFHRVEDPAPVAPPPPPTLTPDEAGLERLPKAGQRRPVPPAKKRSG